jgi:hypothetical protein
MPLCVPRLEPSPVTSVLPEALREAQATQAQATQEQAQATQEQAQATQAQAKLDDRTTASCLLCYLCCISMVNLV